MKMKLLACIFISAVSTGSILHAQTFSFAIKDKPKSQKVAVAVIVPVERVEEKKHVVIFEESREARSPSSFEVRQTDYSYDEGAYRYNLTSK